MVETEEFAEALLDQISVELNEEKEIAQLSIKISEDPNFPKNFTDMEDFSIQHFIFFQQNFNVTFLTI